MPHQTRPSLPRAVNPFLCALILTLALTLAGGLFLSGCGSGSSQATAVALATQAARPTLTYVPTMTPRPSASPTSAVTATPTASATPTPVATAVTGPSLPAAANPGVAENANERPRGSSVVYEPEFPAVSPAGLPPTVEPGINPLTGQVAADPALLQRRPILVRYGNDSAARPHSAISQSEMVMEDLMEAWWITRLTAVFLEGEPEQVGPVRSARPVNIEMTPAFNGVLTFSGASAGVWGLLNSSGLDIVYDGRDGDLFYRSSSRAAPHNLYTSIPDIRARLTSRGIERAVSLSGLTFSDAAPEGGAPAGRVDVPLPPSSVVAWTWDPETWAYRRWVQSKPYTDAETGEQVACENVIVIYAKHWMTNIVEDANGATAIGIALKGGGRAQVFRDGLVYEGTWWREEAKMLFQFIDADGHPIPLRPGHSWIQFLPTTYEVGIN